MQWENLTTPQFAEAVQRSEGVCLVPLGVIEKHGDHLPLGTDLFIGRELALRAAALEPAVVFPPYFFTQIFEARHTPGTIAIPSGVMYDLLQATCDEIARNGLKKIILVNAHGGNRHFLQHFLMLQLERPRDYVVYLPRPGARDTAFDEAWARLRQSTIRDEHAGEGETSTMLAIAPDLVDLAPLPTDEGVALDRLAHLREVQVDTAIGWYADFPHHYSGRGEFGAAEKGEFILAERARKLARLTRLVKDDTAAPALQAEFFARIAGRGNAGG
jgi:creatinine amidohydrolase